MKEYIGRSIDLKNKINKHLTNLTGIDKDFYSTLSNKNLMELKSVLADINNVLTLKMTISAINWICSYFMFSETEKNEIIKATNEIKPNTNGFDIHISQAIKIVAEVKCISPVNNSDKFGAAQRAAILEDFQKLQNGKPSVPNTTNYFKFLFLIDLGERTNNAIESLLKQTNLRVATETRIKRNKIKEKVIFMTNDLKLSDLKIDKIYCKQIEIE